MVGPANKINKKKKENVMPGRHPDKAKTKAPRRGASEGGGGGGSNTPIRKGPTMGRPKKVMPGRHPDVAKKAHPKVGPTYRNPPRTTPDKNKKATDNAGEAVSSAANKLSGRHPDKVKTVAKPPLNGRHPGVAKKAQRTVSKRVAKTSGPGTERSVRKTTTTTKKKTSRVGKRSK